MFIANELKIVGRKEQLIDGRKETDHYCYSNVGVIFQKLTNKISSFIEIFFDLLMMA
jgi:hypothetical protein